MNKMKQPVHVKEIIVALVLVISIMMIYWQVSGHEFVNFDDPQYVSKNPHVNTGLTIENIRWSFKSIFTETQTYWHPLTWISHMVDSQLFGLDSGRHHFVNVLFHMFNTLLLYLFLRRMTGSLWKSAFAAALLAVHPVNVDSVAWLAERKNLLSTFFWILTMICYVHYLTRPTFVRYLLIFISYFLGLLSKPMLVTLPFVLILLDYWPLNRIHLKNDEGKWDIALLKSQKQIIIRSINEKIPLLILALLSIYVSSLSLTGNIISFKTVPVGLRIENAIVSYIHYLIKFLFPYHLTFYYPFPEVVPLWQAVGSFILLAAISWAAVKYAARYPYFIVGWLWYLGTLLPVIGLMQGGLWPAIAERWAYVPLIGIFIIISWGIPDVFSKIPYRKVVLSVSAIAILTTLSAIAWRQTAYWKNDTTLFEHALMLDPDNLPAQYNLALVLSREGKIDDAIHHFKEAIRLKPVDVQSYNHLGLELMKKRKYDEAIDVFKKGLTVDSKDMRIRIDLGRALYEKGNISEALSYFQGLTRSNPESDVLYQNIGVIFLSQGKADEAIENFREALRIEPKNGQVHYNMGIALANKGDTDGAVEHFSRAVALDPGNALAQNNLGNAFLGKGEIEKAINHFQEALRLKADLVPARENLKKAIERKEKIDGAIVEAEGKLGKDPNDVGMLNRLAVLYASKGENARALSYLERVVEITPGSGDAYYNIACIYAREGKSGESIQWLKKAKEKGFNRWDLMRTDRDLQNIRNTTYYKNLVERLPVTEQENKVK